MVPRRPWPCLRSYLPSHRSRGPLPPRLRRPLLPPCLGRGLDRRHRRLCRRRPSWSGLLYPCRPCPCPHCRLSRPPGRQDQSKEGRHRRPQWQGQGKSEGEEQHVSNGAQEIRSLGVVSAAVLYCTVGQGPMVHSKQPGMGVAFSRKPWHHSNEWYSQ